MRFRRHCFYFFLLWVGALGLAVVIRGGTPEPLQAKAAQNNLFPEDELFSPSTNIIHISIEIPEIGMQSLRNSLSGFQRQRIPLERPQAKAQVTEGGRVYTNVAVQVKGTSSFRSIDQKPALTLNFVKLAPNQKFHGLTKISLNNSAQDPTYLYERFSRELFTAAGVPVPRADYAYVALNGRELGLYVLVEGYTRAFLQRHFKKAEGNLYEGGVLQDIDKPMEVSPGNDPTNHAGLKRLIAATLETDPDKRFQALDAALDMSRFISMVALETILCHSDSYSMNRNNYRLYHDLDSGKMVFMPHGMDRVLGTHRTTLDLSIVPPSKGIVAHALLSTPEGRRRYLKRVSALMTTFFLPDKLCERVREINSEIVGDAMSRLASRKKLGAARDGRLEEWEAATSRLVARRDHQVEEICHNIATRASKVREQMAELSMPLPAGSR